MTLGDYGAEVVKIERTEGGDESRAWTPNFPNGISYYFASANRNKRSLAIDLKSPEGVEVVKQLAKEADILVNNFRIGVLEKLGLGYEELEKINPRLIYCTISGFGPTGPRAKDPANDIFMQAYSGNMSITGETGRGPVRAGISIADLGGAMFGVIGVLLALEARHKTGKGQKVDTSLLEGQISMLSYYFTNYFASGKVPVRQGAGSPVAVPYQGFKAKDDWMVVGAFTEKMWQGVCRAIGHADWAYDERFAGTARRVNRDIILPMLEAEFAKKTVAEWKERLDAEGVPCSPVNSLDVLVEDEQVKARNMIVEVEHPNGDKIRMAGLPIELSDTPGSVRRHQPQLGEHSAEVLRELGMSDETIASLIDKGIVATRDVSKK
jgi:crotonobetainyl-CoA:carnitine CoA-transferase CaiB-like acyl-CoA transferase